MNAQSTRDQLRALANTATPGPWENTRNGVQQSLDAATKVGDYKYEGVGVVPEEHVRQEDAEFIAAARTAVPQLLDQLDQAEAELGRLKYHYLYNPGNECPTCAGPIHRDMAGIYWTTRSAGQEQAEAERDEWRQTALDEQGAALDLLEVIKDREQRIERVRGLMNHNDNIDNVPINDLLHALDGDA